MLMKSWWRQYFFAKVLKIVIFQDIFSFVVILLKCMRNKFRESKSDCTVDKQGKQFILTTQECWCQHFLKISFNKISRFKKVFLWNTLLLYNSAMQWQRLIDLLQCSSLHFSSVRKRIFSYLESKGPNNSNWRR